MKVSIVTISYNQAQYLEQCIQSVLEQKYSDIEYIIVDPGSTDGSREIIERYRDRIDKIIFEPDNGPADGLNKGFDQATGRIFGFLNADDYFLSGAIKTIVSAFQSNTGKDVICGNALIVSKEGETLRRFYSRSFSPLRAVYGAATLPQQATFFKAGSFRRAGGFNARNNIAWDGELWIDLALCGARFGRIDEFLAAFRFYKESVTFTKHSSLELSRYLDAMFNKVRGRDKARIDDVLRLTLKGLEYIENPRILIDRLLHGPVLKLEQE